MNNLGKYLALEDVQCKQKAENWEDAIKLAAKPLLESGKIQAAYVERTIEKVKEVGPYIVIAQGVALAHARPKDGITQECLGMATLETPVAFGHKTNDPVEVVFFLAASSDNSHIDALMNIAQKLSEAGMREKITTCLQPQELYDLMVQ